MVRFSPVYNAIPIAPDLLALVSETRTRLLRGVLLYEIGRRINDGKSLEEISSDLRSAHRPSDIDQTITRLLDQRYLTTSVTGSHPDPVFWANLDDAPGGLPARNDRDSVAIVRLVDVDTAPLADAVAAAGYTFRCEQDASLVIVVTDSYLHPALESINAAHLASRVPWVLAKPVGAEMLLGPLFSPPGGACWECLAHRLRLNRVFERAISDAALEVDTTAPIGYVASSLRIAYAILAAELEKSLIRSRTVRIEGHILSVEFATMATRRHRVVGRPACRACQPTALGAANGSNLRTLRIATPKVLSDTALLSEYEHHISPLTGIVRSLDEISLADKPEDLYLYSAGLTLGRRLTLHQLLADNPANYAVGRGSKRDAAKVGALFEAFERYSMTYDGTQPLIHATQTSVGDAAIHPNSCMLFSDRQYASGNAPLPYTKGKQIAWVEGWSLIANEPRYLPAALCFSGAETVAGKPFCVCDSNGVAAGSSLKDAAVRAFLELIERDAASIWWFNQLPRPSVDISNEDDELCRNVVTAFARRNRDVWMCEITSDIQVPCWAAISCARDGTDLWFGFSAALSHRAAVTRALLELCQRLPSRRTTVQRGASAWSLSRFPFVRCHTPVPLASFSESLEPHADRLEICCRAAIRAGLDVSAFELTRKDIGASVVRLVVPGLRHLRPRFAPGRLYDVPVHLGLRTQPLEENELSEVGPVNDSREGIQ